MSDESATADIGRGEGAEGFPHGSKYPFFLAVGLFFTGVGLSMWLPVLVIGVPIVLYGMWGWTTEYSVEEYERAVRPEQKRQLLGVRSGYLAAILVVGGELLVFAGLFVTWFYLNSTRAQFFPPAADLPPPTLSLGVLMTAALLVGSLTFVYARRSISRGHRRGLNVGIAVTFVLGLAFLALLADEWSSLMGAGFTWTSGPYGASYYVITGIHLVHMLVGMVLVGIVGYRSLARGHFGRDRHLMVSTTELYWHFLTFVSVLILAFVYFPTTVG
ncbi:MAG: cytochrome c oxidase subunit 4 [Halanaeroarchaeum sp.]